MSKRIILITSGQPSVNPRLVKEADALSNIGFNVIVIYQYWNEWATEMDKVLLAKKKWKAIRVGGSPDDEKLTFWYSRFLHKKNQLLSKYFPFFSNEFSAFRCTKFLLKEAAKFNADLYIAHNLGAIAAAVTVAKRKRAKCGFDAEDFHRQEVSDDNASSTYKLAKLIEDKYLPQIDYMTCASPLIAKAYQEIYSQISPLVINNVFPSFFVHKPQKDYKKSNLKLLWFSQTIGKGRGIEDAMEAIALLKKNDVSLTLLGYIDKVHQTYFLKLANKLGLDKNQLFFIKPVAPDNIFRLASKYDIGLALEQKTPLNRDLCLTNKIFTYLTSGLAIIACETTAQKNLLLENPLIGKSYPISDIQTLSLIIDQYYNNRELLYKTKLASQKLAEKKLNWEDESKKFIQLIEKTIRE